MAGRPRLPIGTFGEISTREVAPGRFRSATRFRDWDGQTRQVTASGKSRSAAIAALKANLSGRQRGGGSDVLTADSRFADLAAAWLEDVWLDPDRSDGTKEVYERELRTLILPTFQHFTVREVTVGRIERFLKTQGAKSFARAKHSRGILSMVMGFAVRREIVGRNPVTETSRMKKPKRTPKALTEVSTTFENWSVSAVKSEHSTIGE
ncbi:phage integrase central domain-containing protein [Microbacterium pygmaeum]|uniref:Phage integrase central domain-containing protein n=1 Tax=Microbacterium pygmaeum TaxID=370764 RepID=A0A1G7X6D9_9MICO|nr:hypothetical protein [Microbacterium pygmaeum]SDG79759.1 hypothetical protein SAMN04489810_1322 [Microbacterium pygmaeum]